MSIYIDPRDVRVARSALFRGSGTMDDLITAEYHHPDRLALRSRYSEGLFDRLVDIPGGAPEPMLVEALKCARTPADRALIERLIAEESL